MVSFEKRGRLAMIVFAWPVPKDIPFIQISAELEDIRAVICRDNDISVVVLSGQQAFSAGPDGGAWPSLEIEGEQCPRLSLSSTIDAIDRPVIAAIEGDAFGQGLELVLACDLRICSEVARFGMPHVAFGEIPCDGGTQRLPRLVGKSKAIEMILTGRSINAQEARRIGLVNEVVPPEELMKGVKEIAHKMSSRGPIALRYAKEATQKGMDLTLEQGLRLEADLYFLLHTTRDRTEGIKAYQEKRNPQFEGR